MTQAANLAALGTNAGTTGILPAAGGGTAGTAGVSGFKNRLINGNMVTAQRGTSFSGLSDDGGQYTLDRWRWSENGTYTGSQTVTQDTSAPTGFINSLKVVTNTAITVGTSLSSRVEQFIEGLNCADLAWGTASAKTVTLSFWVRSSLTGTFGGAIRNSDDNRSYPFSYTINAANTWEYETITIPGDTSGTWLTTNGTGMRVTFSLGAGTALSATGGSWYAAGYQSVTGAVAVNATLNATFYITGCQLEVGTAATNFDVRSYGTEMNLCQRYYQLVGGGSAQGGQSSTIIYWGCVLPVKMRANPSLGQTGPQYFNKPGVDVWNQSSVGLTGAASTTQGVYTGFSNISGVTTQAPYLYNVSYAGNPTYVTCDAEL
jgi:hypothetical protein